MKIGIGITTFNRPECLEYVLSQHRAFSPANQFDLHVAENVPNVARAKNENLYHLRNCDYIFLFDDDCFPIKPGWDMPFIESGMGHLLYMDENYLPAQRLEDYTRYRDCSGCFMFISKPVFEKVGYFNTKYGQYGYEHLAYSTRCKTLLKDWGFCCLNKTSKYIYSLDLQGRNGWHVPPGLHYKPTFSTEQAAELKKNNHAVYLEEIEGDQLYYPYGN